MSSSRPAAGRSLGDSLSRALLPGIAALVGVLGLVSLLGILTGSERLARVATGGGPLAPLSALGLVAGATVLWLLRPDAAGRNANAARALSAFILAGGLTVFVLRLAGIIPTPEGQWPSLALSFATVGGAMLLADLKVSGRWGWLQLPLFPVFWISLLVILAQFYGMRTVDPYFRLILFPVQTAIPLVLLCVGVFLLHPRAGVWGILSSAHLGGILARTAIPLMLVLPFTVGWIRVHGLRAGFLDLGGAFAQFVTTNILTFTAFILFTAHVLNRLDARRQETFESLRTANAELEARIAEQRRAEAAREESERQLFQAQKMEAMGVLASGIAHDFNNILTVILLNADEAAATAVDDPALRRNILEIRKSGERAAGLIRQIMAFGRNEPGRRGLVSLGEVIAETDEMLRPMLPEGIALLTGTDPDLPEVYADAGQLRQVLVNLANNALHAMEGSRGLLEIRARAAAAGLEPPQGLGAGHVVVTVRDTGHGMEAEVAKRIFDPFFTTKAPGKGTGLGLSVVHGIMRLHGGAVAVRSEPGKGSEFALYLPAPEKTRE